MKMRKWVVPAITGMMLTVVLAGDTVDFTGTWILNESKLEETGDGPRMVPEKVVIKQEEKSITTDKYMYNEMMGEFTISVTVTLDGKECVAEEEFGTRKSTATWSEDKKALTIHSTLLMNWNGQDTEIATTEVLSLEEDGSLKSHVTSEGPMGVMDHVNYFKKSEKQ